MVCESPFVEPRGGGNPSLWENGEVSYVTFGGGPFGFGEEVGEAKGFRRDERRGN